MREGRSVLLAREADPALKDLAASADLPLHETELPWSTAAVLMRPDGHVWAAGDTAAQLADSMAELPLNRGQSRRVGKGTRSSTRGMRC